MSKIVGVRVRVRVRNRVFFTYDSGGGGNVRGIKCPGEERPTPTLKAR